MALLGLALISCSGIGSLGGMNPGSLEAGPPAAAKPQDEDTPDSPATEEVDSNEVNPAWQPHPVARANIAGDAGDVGDVGGTQNTDPMEPGLLSPSKITDPGKDPDYIVIEKIHDLCQTEGQHKYQVDAWLVPFKKKYRVRWLRVIDLRRDAQGVPIENSGDYVNLKMAEEGVRKYGGWAYPFSFSVTSEAFPAWVFRRLVREDDGPFAELVLDTELPCDESHCEKYNARTLDFLPPIDADFSPNRATPQCNRSSRRMPLELPDEPFHPELAPAGR